jgi:cytidylate kinase
LTKHGPSRRPDERRQPASRAQPPKAAPPHLDHLDRTHTDYAQELYGADVTAFQHYDLMIDSTRIPAEACIELICAAAKADNHAE